jgi:hypothetical protein
MSIHFRNIVVHIALVPIVVFAAVAPLVAGAFTYPLSSTDIRDAYFIGRRNDEVTSNFLLQYTRHFNPPASGPDISDIAVETPFTQVVQYSSQMANYDAPTAVQDFQDRPLKVYVHVFVYEDTASLIDKANPVNPLYHNIWEDYGVKLMQDKAVKPLEVTGGFIYPTCGDGCLAPAPIGAHIDLTFSAEQIDASPATITVEGPDDVHTEATFDFSTLR